MAEHLDDGCWLGDGWGGLGLVIDDDDDGDRVEVRWDATYAWVLDFFSLNPDWEGTDNR